ncbi:MAG: ATP-binding protein [Kiritimatiellaeota bacterium]|nr:ATP-binding protein [Kiritimatiellota bacterium]
MKIERQGVFGTGGIALSLGDANAVISRNVEMRPLKCEAIRIRNLGPIKDVAIDDIKPFTVFIGESAGGKSAIMKVVVLFRWLFKRYNLHANLETAGILLSPLHFDTDKQFKYVGLSGLISETTEIQYSVTFEGDPQPFHIKYLQKRFEKEGSIPAGGLSYSKLAYITETRSFLAFLLGTNRYRPDDDSLFDDMLDNFHRAVTVRNGLDIDFLNIQFVSQSTSFGKKYEIASLDKDTYQIGFNDSSSGIQNAVPILLLASYFAKDFDLTERLTQSLFTMVKDSGKLTDFRPISETDTLPKRVFLHIEEPELGLFPDVQYNLLNRLITLGSSETYNPIHFMLTTHSPYILNHLNLLIKAYDARSTQFTEGASLNFDDIAAYHVTDGGIEDLKRIVGKRLIDTDILSDPINDTYDRFEELES